MLYQLSYPRVDANLALFEIGSSRVVDRDTPPAGEGRRVLRSLRYRPSRPPADAQAGAGAPS